MKGLGKFCCACVGALALAGCGTQLQQAEKISPQGSEFNQGLYQGYLGLAKSETGEGDYQDSDTFALRAIAAGTGAGVAPEAISARQLPADKVGELSGARDRLVAALAKGAAEKMPDTSAVAQVKFDCWMQEQEENFQPDHIAGCRSDFYDTLAQLESGLAVKPVAKAEPPKPAPQPKPGAERFVVYFETDSSKLDPAAQTVLAEAEAAAKKFGDARVTVAGYTDTVGANTYNDTLSQLRADAVAKALAAGGVTSTAISTSWYGETNLAIPTADSTDAAGNRRVEIIVQP